MKTIQIGRVKKWLAAGLVTLAMLGAATPRPASADLSFVPNIKGLTFELHTGGIFVPPITMEIFEQVSGGYFSATLLRPGTPNSFTWAAGRIEPGVGDTLKVSFTNWVGNQTQTYEGTLEIDQYVQGLMIHRDYLMQGSYTLLTKVGVLTLYTGPYPFSATASTLRFTAPVNGDRGIGLGPRLP